MATFVSAGHAPPLVSAAAHIGTGIFTSGATIGVVDPFSGNEIGTTHECGADLVDEAVQTAGAAFTSWSQTSVDARAAVLRRVADILQTRGDVIATTVTREMGMPCTLAQATQQILPAAVLRATADAAQQFPWTERIDGGTVRRVAGGVVAAITPWNMPVHQIVAKVSAALAAGCTVVLKPSEATPFDAAQLRQCFLDAGLPADAFAIVNGTGPITGQALSAHPGIAHVSFTGSVRGGRAVARAAAQTLTRTTLELGGKSPAVVLPDADFPDVLPRVVASGLVNSGQACNATSRLLLPSHRSTEAEAILAQALTQLAIGDPASPTTTHGPLASLAQTERVLAAVDTAHAAGARVVAGSGRPMSIGRSECFVSPVIFGDLPPDAATVRDEIFGPVLVVQYYDDVPAAIDLANDSDYGLSAEVWSANNALALDVANALDVGQVKINGVRTRERPAVPFGGVKNSGYGRELGAAGIAEFTELKAIMQ
ncbi:aldehyde dehydrogenase family protein [Gordonia sp. TBRC 11910]|uniref:aldehyde dehydrogenase (NAD(+)) n=1 Tax=Gordonia asplenii TaxID=2725283 RepID=A0A848L2U3_9ACTN|nr:aldehyde dehydrogenase family protein [Gordonia asplenii]NMO04827.1 aldehyde dehydrogenase family protein [Gordonia asplenii]